MDSPKDETIISETVTPKKPYTKPVLTKHKALRDITAQQSGGPGPGPD